MDAVEEEYRAATTAIMHVLRTADRDPTLLQRLSIERRPLRICLRSMEQTEARSWLCEFLGWMPLEW